MFSHAWKINYGFIKGKNTLPIIFYYKNELLNTVWGTETLCGQRSDKSMLLPRLRLEPITVPELSGAAPNAQKKQEPGLRTTHPNCLTVTEKSR